MDKHLSLNEYFFHVIWTPLYEEIATALNPVNKSLDLFDELILLRGAFLVGHDLQAVNEELEITLHKYLLQDQKVERAEKVRNVIKEILAKLDKKNNHS